MKKITSFGFALIMGCVTSLDLSTNARGADAQPQTSTQPDFKNPEGFENSAYLHSIPPQKFDVIVVDGAEDAVPVRPICFYHAENFINPGGIIVVDDSWRYPELRRINRAAKHRIFKSVGPCRPGVTSTDIFFY